MTDTQELNEFLNDLHDSDGYYMKNEINLIELQNKLRSVSYRPVCHGWVFLLIIQLTVISSLFTILVGRPNHITMTKRCLSRV